MNFSLQIPDRRVQDLIESVSLILPEFPLITARNLAQVTGKIISMSPVNWKHFKIDDPLLLHDH